MSDPAKAPPPVLYRGLKRALDRPGADRAVVIAALCLLGFSLDTGLSGDDYIHELIGQGSHAIAGFVRPPYDMFRFAGAPYTEALMREGVLGWWEDPEAKLAFFRPLSALTHVLDSRLWPNSGFLMHLHSLLWAALLYAGLLTLYRALVLPPFVATLATFVYVFDDARGWIGSWVAARNAIIATAISVWVLVLHHRSRGSVDGEGTRPPRPAGEAVGGPPHRGVRFAHDLSRPGEGLRSRRVAAVLAPVLLLLALLAGEGSIAICGYLFAYAVCLDRAPLTERAASLLPYAAVVVPWRLAWRALGYGVAHSGLYFDPLGEPLGFLGALVDRAPILLCAQLGGAWSDIWNMMFAFPVVQSALYSAACFGVLVFGYALWPVFAHDRVVRFGVLGALLAVLPASAAFPADRLLTWIAIGGSIAVARLLAAYGEDPEWLGKAPLRALVLPPLMLCLLFAKTVIDPVFMPSRARGNLVIRDNLDRAQGSVPMNAAITHKRIVYVNPPAVPLAAYVPIERAAQGQPRALSQVWLATGETDLRYARPDGRSLRVRQRGGFLLSPGSHLLRNPKRAFTRGTSIALEGLRITVSDLMPDGRPAEIIAHFDRPLEDAGLLFLVWKGLGYVTFTPPAVGASVTLPAVDLAAVLLGNTLKLPIDGRMPAPRDPSFE